MSKQTSIYSSTTTSVSPLSLQIVAWLIVGLASLLAILVWGHDYGWRLTPFSPYQVFPLLGLLAFSIMWSHYINGALREMLGLKQSVLSTYYRSTSYVVLALICLHPGLLIYQRFRDGYGTPPHSYESYVAPGLGWITILGSASLLVFLAFEFRRVFGKKPWWHFVADASDFAMLAIVYHGLKLGGDLQQGWFRYAWYFYGITLVIVLVRKYVNRLTAK